MFSLARPAEPVHVGMDVSKNTIMAAVLWPADEVPVTDRVFNDEPSVRRLLERIAGKAGGRELLRCCYEAGPGGYDLYRLVDAAGISCDVVAPSLIPKGSGDRVKTDKRDACRLARLHRAGELTAVRVPSREEEAARDLVRARGALLEDRKRAQQRLTAVLMRHGRTWHGPTSWTKAHRDWIAAQKFTEPALAAAIACYRAALDTRETELAAAEARLLPWASREPLAGPAARLMCYRGIAELTALTLAAEVVDWHRFPSARAFMGFTGLCPAEYSSGDKTRRGHITKAGPEPVRTALIEAAWSYRHAPAAGVTLRPAGRRGPGHPGPVLEGAAAAARPVRAPGHARQDTRGGGHRDRPGARRVHLGRDDLLTPVTRISRRRAGMLAAAGTIPVNFLTAAATLGYSLGHHPAGTWPANPTRAYETGSDGHGRRPCPARRPHRPRSPPAAGDRETLRSLRRQPIIPLPGQRPQGRLRRRYRERCAPLDPGTPLAANTAPVTGRDPDRHAPQPWIEPP